MTRQTLSQAARPTVAKAIVALGLVILLAEYGQSEWLFCEIFGAAARMALKVLPSFVLAAWQAVQGHGFGHFPPCEGLLQFSGCCWSAIANLAGAA
jgi:hypothetical protein